MHGALHLLGQCRIDAALALDARQTGKLGRDDAHGEMGLTLAAVCARGAMMSRMAMAIVRYRDFAGAEGRSELGADGVGDAHDPKRGVDVRAKVKQYLFLFFTLSHP